MNPLGTLRVALRALLRNRLRSVLTMLGIIIGVGAFVAMVAIGEGVRAKIESSIAGIGSNMLVVFPGSVTQGGAQRGTGSASTLMVGDSDAMELLPAIRRSAPIVRGAAQVVWGSANWSAPIVGTTPGYIEIRAWGVDEGHMFSDDDVRSGNKVCVIGTTIVKNLFGAQPALGESIRVKGMPCKVVGVLSEKGGSGTGSDDDDVVIVPWTTAKRRLVGGDPHTISIIVASAVSPEATQIAQRQIEGLIRQRHHISEGDPDDFIVRDLREIARTAGETAGILTKLLGSIALISLLVGGIGIMNIMLVSVTERTREIGIRVALGARGRDILTQFLVEAVLLCLLGGAIGVALGIWAAGAVARSMGWPELVSMSSLAIAFAFAALVGVVFGLYPALRASRLDPIDALRYE